MKTEDFDRSQLYIYIYIYVCVCVCVCVCVFVCVCVCVDEVDFFQDTGWSQIKSVKNVIKDIFKDNILSWIERM